MLINDKTDECEERYEKPSQQRVNLFIYLIACMWFSLTKKLHQSHKYTITDMK